MDLERILLTFMFAILTPIYLQNHPGAKNNSINEQSSFSSEDSGLAKPVAAPSPIIMMIRSDPHVLNALKAQHLSADELPVAWISTSEIHLHSAAETDYLVMGVGHLRGANIVPFWIFSPTKNGFRLILHESAGDLKILSTRTQNYRDIQLDAIIRGAVSTLHYRFDGTAYRLGVRSQIKDSKTRGQNPGKPGDRRNVT